MYQGNALINGTMGNVLDTTNSTAATGVQASTIQLTGAQAGVYTIAQSERQVDLELDGCRRQRRSGRREWRDGVQTVNFARFGVSFNDGHDVPSR